MKYLNEIVKGNFTGSMPTYEDLISCFILNSGASGEDLIKCTLYFDNRLPVEYKFFLEKYNGATLFKVEDFAGFKLFSTYELITQNHFQMENFGSDWDNKIILFCECLGDGEFLGFRSNDMNNYEILYCIMDTSPGEWLSIDSSFDNLLVKIIEEKGRKFWL